MTSPSRYDIAFGYTILGLVLLLMLMFVCGARATEIPQHIYTNTKFLVAGEEDTRFMRAYAYYLDALNLVGKPAPKLYVVHVSKEWLPVVRPTHSDTSVLVDIHTDKDGSKEYVIWLFGRADAVEW